MKSPNGKVFYSQEKQELAKLRSEDRVRAIKKQGLIAHAAKRIPVKYTERLLLMRESTVSATIDSLTHEKKPSHRFSRTSPTSDRPNFQALRHDPMEKRRMVVETQEGFHNVSPKAVPVTPVKLVRKNPPLFRSPGQTLYKPGRSVIQAASGEIVHPLQRISAQQQLVGRGLFHDTVRVRGVSLSYANLARPAGHAQPINNKQSQGGFSAHELADRQFDVFEKGLIDLGFATHQEMLAFKELFDEVQHEHTHMIASHFGILTDQEKQRVDPRDPDSTFVAPAALNSDMMLFEKFVDFILFINYHRHGHAYREKTVDYTCEVLLFPGTTQPARLSLQVTDHHTNKTFTQMWENPWAVTEKPSAAMYTTLLQLLKASLDNHTLAGAPVVSDHPLRPR